jgi:GNAT superfamily N-acetyltransferase
MHKLLCFEEHLAHPIAEGKKTSTAVLACMAKGHDARKKRDSCENHALLFSPVFVSVFPEDQLKSMSSVDKRQAYWREAIEFCEPQVQVAIDGDKIVGFVGFDRSRDEKSRQTTGEIWAIYAAPTHWNQGVGVALWDAARDGLLEEGCTNVTSWVPLRNERALRFHELAGFKREMSTAKTAQVGALKIEEVRLKRALN